MQADTATAAFPQVARAGAEDLLMRIRKISVLRRSILLTLLCALSAAPAHAKEDCARLDSADVAGWFDQWNLALATLNAEQVAQRYWQDAVLLPTFANTPHTTTTMIREYYQGFLEKHPRGRIDTRSVRLGCNLVIDMGTYTFSLIDGTGHTSDVPARYTFVYQYRAGAWKILHHHSSAMSGDAKPEKPARRSGWREGVVNARAPIGGSQPFLNPETSPNVTDFYPPEARARGEQGAVAMRICTGPSGEMSKAPEIIESSGSSELDSAAQDWATAASWIPATRQNSAVEGCTRVRIEFRPS